LLSPSSQRSRKEQRKFEAAVKKFKAVGAVFDPAQDSVRDLQQMLDDAAKLAEGESLLAQDYEDYDQCDDE
jgi:hypothetical protein